mgnify:CR=1 FL=1
MGKLIVIFAILISPFVNAQQIPNGDFENWEQKPYGEEPANWGEYSLQLFHSVFPGLVDSTIVKSEDAYSGSYAMELRSKDLTGFMSDTIIPIAMLNLTKSNIDSAMMKIDSTLESLSGYIKQDIVDSAENSTSIAISVYSKGDIIGIGALEFTEDIFEYTSFNIPIMYFDDERGDSIDVMIIAGNSDNPLPGNIMLLDNFKLNYQSISTNLEENLQNEIKVYPNPFIDNFTIDLNSNNTKEYKIYSLIGEMVLKGTVNPNMNTINLSNLPPNTYLLTINNQTIKILKNK